MLLVEDTPQVLTLLRLMLESLRYRVLTATNGQEALRVYERYGNTIALVVADLVMPNLGGMALFQALRKRAPGVKVIILTGYLLHEEVHMLRAQGITAILPKPPNAPYWHKCCVRRWRSDFFSRSLCDMHGNAEARDGWNAPWKPSGKRFAVGVIWLSAGLSCGSPRTS